jgi:hypothetical protein
LVRHAGHWQCFLSLRSCKYIALAMQGGRNAGGLPQLPQHMVSQHYPPPFADRSQDPPFQSYQHPAPLYQPPRHLQHNHHRQQQQLLPQGPPFQQQHQQPQQQGHYQQHWQPLPPPGLLPAVSSPAAPLQWASTHPGEPCVDAANSAALQQHWHLPPPQEAPWQPAAAATRGAHPAADAASLAVRRTLSTPPAADGGEGGPVLQRPRGLHSREQSWDDFSPAQPPPDASLRAPSAPAVATRRRPSAGTALLQGRPLQPEGAPPHSALASASHQVGSPPAGQAQGEADHVLMPHPDAVQQQSAGTVITDGKYLFSSCLMAWHHRL